MCLLLYFFINLLCISICYAGNECFKLETSITQKVEHEGFHRCFECSQWNSVLLSTFNCRELRWLIESSPSSKASWIHASCRLSLQLQVSNGMYVNPDEVAELNRTGKVIIIEQFWRNNFI